MHSIVVVMYAHAVRYLFLSSANESTKANQIQAEDANYLPNLRSHALEDSLHLWRVFARAHRVAAVCDDTPCRMWTRLRPRIDTCVWVTQQPRDRPTRHNDVLRCFARALNYWHVTLVELFLTWAEITTEHIRMNDAVWCRCVEQCVTPKHTAYCLILGMWNFITPRRGWCGVDNLMAPGSIDTCISGSLRQSIKSKSARSGGLPSCKRLHGRVTLSTGAPPK